MAITSGTTIRTLVDDQFFGSAPATMPTTSVVSLPPTPCPTNARRCLPFFRSDGISNVAVTVPSAAVISSPSLRGVENNHTSTVEPAAKPSTARLNN